MLTHRGRRMIELVVIVLGWAVGSVLILTTAFWEVMFMRLSGLVMLFAVATYTCVTAIGRRDDVIRAAFEMGRETEKSPDVTPLLR